MPKVNNLVQGTGERLKEARYFLQMNQTQFSSLLGLSLSQYGKIERGDRPINPKYVQVLEGKGIDVNYVITGKGKLKKEVTADARQISLEGLTDSQIRLIIGIVELMKDENAEVVTRKPQE